MVREARNKSKTETSKDRLIYVYLPSFEITNKWKGMADKADTSISKFVIEHVENSLQQLEGNNDYISMSDLQKQLRELKKENQILQKNNKIMDTVIDRLEEELKTYRTKPFSQDYFLGTRDYESDLIKAFKSRGEIKKEEIFDILKVNMKDRDVVKGLREQIRKFEKYGFIKDRGVSWKWMP